jgi:hypothetical protein
MVENRMEQIKSRIAEICKLGWEPVLLVVNYKVLQELEEETGKFGTGNLTTYFGLPNIVKDKIADFFVVDTRSWVYQK